MIDVLSLRGSQCQHILNLNAAYSLVRTYLILILYTLSMVCCGKRVVCGSGPTIVAASATRPSTNQNVKVTVTVAGEQSAASIASRSALVRAPQLPST
jgi:hypothetical protein